MQKLLTQQVSGPVTKVSCLKLGLLADLHQISIKLAANNYSIVCQQYCGFQITRGNETGQCGTRYFHMIISHVAGYTMFL